MITKQNEAPLMMQQLERQAIEIETLKKLVSVMAPGITITATQYVTWLDNGTFDFVQSAIRSTAKKRDMLAAQGATMSDDLFIRYAPKS